MYIDEWPERIQTIITGILEPIHLGRAKPLSIQPGGRPGEGIAGIRRERKYDLTDPQGVNGRATATTLDPEISGWRPTSSPDGDGEDTFWIYGPVPRRGKRARPEWFREIRDDLVAVNTVQLRLPGDGMLVPPLDNSRYNDLSFGI